MALYIESLCSYTECISDIINNYVKALEPTEEGIVGSSSVLPTEESRIKYYADIQNILKDIYRALNLSAISGEYVNRIDFEKIIQDISSEFKEIITLLPDQVAEEESETLINITNCIKLDLELYKFQVHLFWKSVTNPKVKFVDYDIINNDNVPIKDYNMKDIKLLSDIFHANLNLVLIDREFSFHEQVFCIINAVYHKLDEYKQRIETDYIDILLYKCRILLAKFNYKDNIDNLLQSYNYYKGQDEKVAMSVDGSICKRLREIYTKDAEDYKRAISRWYQESIDTYSSFFDFFIKCHYLKNIAENEVLLQDLIKRFEEFRKKINTDDLFDKKNASSCLNFLYNCRLSFILKQKETSSITVWNENRQIKSIQDSTNIQNYFPFLKIAEWYSAYLSKQIEETDNANDLMTDLDRFEKCLTCAEKYLIDSRDIAGCFIPFKPGFKECLEDYTIKEGEYVKIFISSSYVVPVDYEKEDKRIEKLQSDLIKLKAIIEAKRTIDLAIIKLRKENELLKKQAKSLKNSLNTETNRITENVQSDLKENQKNNIQILAIFAGIVIFASGTIQIFKGASNIKDATIFMLLFASALSIISLSIWLLYTSKKEWDATKFIVVCILAIILGLNTYAIFGDWGKSVIHTPNQETSVK